MQTSVTHSELYDVIFSLNMHQLRNSKCFIFHIEKKLLKEFISAVFISKLDEFVPFHQMILNSGIFSYKLPLISISKLNAKQKE